MWQYGEFGIRDSYYADVALEGMYRRFLESDDWSELVNDLWNFHSSYGSGIFLKYRNFIFDGALKPIHELRAGDFGSADGRGIPYTVEQCDCIYADEAHIRCFFAGSREWAKRP